MTAQELLDLFRTEVVDTRKPYLWKDEEVLAYMDDAYKMFVRLTGGIADFTSDMTKVDIVAGENVADVDPRILRFMRASRASDGREIQIVNQTDMMTASRDDYGIVRALYNDSTPGEVKYMIIGQQRGKCRWAQIPEFDDVANLDVYRLPLTKIATDGSNLDFDFDEIGEEHHQHLVLWMQHRAYRKPDADAFDPGRSDAMKQQFDSYCNMAKSEWERSKHKTRVVSYGGL